MKFDWIDFGASWNEPREEPGTVDPLLHNSTASLLAEFLRRRDAPFRKVFCWMRRDKGVLEPSVTPGVRHVEASFPFMNYEAASETDRLVIFADWLVNTVSSGAPELGIDQDEAEALKRQLAGEQFTYSRLQKLKRVAGEPRCEVLYRHTPTGLTIVVTCKTTGGNTLTRTLPDPPFRRDELVYGRSISRCVVREDGALSLETYLGVL